MNLIDTIRVIEDFPKEGISFKDITTLLKSKDAFHQAIEEMIELARAYEFDYVMAAEARGFVLGTPLAFEMHKGFIPVRKPGKLPGEVYRHAYDLEYGTDAMEVHSDALQPGDRVLIVDDLLATGGTSKAMCEMVKHFGAEVVGCLYLIELTDLPGRQVLDGYAVNAVISY